ncbi:MAG TPA: 3-phosphoshikimate 1-carboxyvinyltransferase [Actinomycetota bacterium]|nr:3-phosphoshikimate 1-carboxyvinyltransferase [Actinomycetota bacterium]
MRLRVTPGSALGPATVRVPGDKSIAHRWLILAATADGLSRLVEVPPSLDVRSTAVCLSSLLPDARPALERWTRNVAAAVEAGGSTWNVGSSDGVEGSAFPVLEVDGHGRDALVSAGRDLDCGNSGTSMRLFAGVVAAAPFRTVLTGDASLERRPMERIAAPLRSMGASVATTDGHAPITIDGGPLHGIRYEVPVPSAQVKSAVLFAGIAAEGETTVVEPAATRDHTERALRALGADVTSDGASVTVRRSRHRSFDGRVPGDPSSAAFLVAGAAITGSRLTIERVGVNPTRTRYLDVMRRMGVTITVAVTGEEVGEPVGDLRVEPPSRIAPVVVDAAELPLVVDEVPVLAALAAHADGPSWFEGARELRVKESDRLVGLAERFRALGHHAGVEDDALTLAGRGVRGGRVTSGGDHRIAMAFAVAALAADAPVEIDGMEAEAVSFPGFSRMLLELGAAAQAVEG